MEQKSVSIYHTCTVQHVRELIPLLKMIIGNNLPQTELNVTEQGFIYFKNRLAWELPLNQQSPRNESEAKEAAEYWLKEVRKREANAYNLFKNTQNKAESYLPLFFHTNWIFLKALPEYSDKNLLRYWKVIYSLKLTSIEGLPKGEARVVPDHQMCLYIKYKNPMLLPAIDYISRPIFKAEAVQSLLHFEEADIPNLRMIENAANHTISPYKMADDGNWVAMTEGGAERVENNTRSIEKKGTRFYYQEFEKEPQNIAYWGKNPIDPKNVKLIKLGIGDDGLENTIGIIYYTKDLKRLLQEREDIKANGESFIVNTKTLKHYFKFDLKLRMSIVEMIDNIKFYGNIVEQGLLEVEITKKQKEKENVERKIIKLEVALPQQATQPTVSSNLIHTESIGIIKTFPLEAIAKQKINLLNNEYDTNPPIEVEGKIWEVYRKIVIVNGDFSSSGIKGAVLLASFISDVYYKELVNSDTIRFETVEALLEKLTQTNSELLNKECFIKFNLAEILPFWENDAKDYKIEVVSDFHTHPDNQLQKPLNASPTDYNFKRSYQKDALLYVPQQQAIVFYIGGIDKDNLQEGTFMYKYIMENATSAQTDNIPIDNDKYIENPQLKDNGAAFYVTYKWFSEVSF